METNKEHNHTEDYTLLDGLGLDKELYECVDARDVMGMYFIKHPYFSSSFYPKQEDINDQINKINNSFRKKMKWIDDFLEKEKREGKWKWFLSNMVELPYMFDEFLTHKDKLTDKEYWETLGYIFTLTEFQSRQIDDWISLFNSKRPERENLMNDDDWVFYNQLPDKIMIWRGVNDENFVKGLSWTTDKERGEWFAERFSHIYGEKILCKTRIEKEKILMCSPHESLIVCNPKDINNVLISNI
jgi:hypothetical protein